jgi:hypothetical protein
MVGRPGTAQSVQIRRAPATKGFALQRVIDEANGYYAARLARWISLSKPDYDFFGGSPNCSPGYTRRVQQRN